MTDKSTRQEFVIGQSHEVFQLPGTYGAIVNTADNVLLQHTGNHKNDVTLFQFK